MAVTRSRRVPKRGKITIKKEEEEEEVNNGENYAGSSSDTKSKEEAIQLPIGRSSELYKLQSLKMKGETIRLLTKLRPQFKKAESRDFQIDKSSIANLTRLIRYNKSEQQGGAGNRQVNEELKSCMTRFNLQMMKNIVNENKNLCMLNFKQNISEVKHSELLQDHYTKLSNERQQLLNTFHELYNYKPELHNLLNDINKLPNFNKKCVSKRRNPKSKEKPKRPHHNDVNDLMMMKKKEKKKSKYPLTISNLHKNMTMAQVTTLKQQQLLKTCHIYDLRLKNIDFENSKFDINNVQINDDEIYPMDDIYLRSDEDSDDDVDVDGDGSGNGDNGELKDHDGMKDFGFILEGLSPEDYMGERDFDEREEFIKV